MRSCKTCTSTHKEEIEAKILDGFPCEEISRWLLEEYDEKISGQAIRNHIKHHMLPGDILPSNIILEKINQLDDKINVINELSKLINCSKRRLADSMAHELKLGCGKSPVFLPETLRVMKELREQLSLHFKITGVEAPEDLATWLSKRDEEIQPEIKRIREELEKRTP